MFVLNPNDVERRCSALRYALELYKFREVNVAEIIAAATKFECFLIGSGTNDVMPVPERIVGEQ